MELKGLFIQHIKQFHGAGQLGIEDLINTSNGKTQKKFFYPICNNCLPHIDVFLENDYTKEEIKMIEETRKIFHMPLLNVTATCVRVPVINSHSESINIELENEYKIEDIKDIYKNTKGIILLDNPQKNLYPINSLANDTDAVYVGRIRRDFSQKNSLNIWVVADNIRKGAATNAVQILEILLSKNNIKTCNN